MTRTEAEHDGRVRTLSLTSAGRRFVDRVSEARLEQILATVQGVPGAMREGVLSAMQWFLSNRKGGKA